MKKYVLVIIGVLFSIGVRAQDNTKDEAPSCTINIIGRYSEKGVQLIYFPDKHASFRQGLKHGYVIERAELPDSLRSIDDLKFVVVKEAVPFTESEWEKAFETTDPETAKNLGLARQYYDDRNTVKGGEFSFDKGIKEMKEQKFKEDFEFIIFAMTAIKDNKVAESLGLSFTDKTSIPEKHYVYRIKLKKELSQFKTESILFDIKTVKEDAKIERKIYVKPGDTKLSFVWEENDMVTGAHVERKNPATGEFELLNESPSLNVAENSQRNGYTDTSLTNYVTYEYRFYGYNPFGEKVYFGEASGMPRDFTPPRKPNIISIKHEKPEEVHVNWETILPMDGDLKGFVISRSTNDRTGFQILHSKMLPKNSTNYIDKTFSREESNYYIIQAMDTSGNISTTAPYFVSLIDSTGPAQPEFISGKIDSLGIVTIDIKPNEEKDLMGYRLYKANAPEHEFSVIYEGFHEKDTVYRQAQSVFNDTVTINSLTPYIYYRIRALDFNFNQSEFSEILKVKRPDIIPPTTPVFKNVVVRKEEVELHFALSNSEDVDEQYIYRKIKYSDDWELLSTLENDQTIYIDEEVEQGIKYLYSLRAKDDSELYSDYAVAVFGKPYDDGVRPVVEKLKASSEDNVISLSWKYPEKYEDAYFVVYKKDKEGNLRQFKNTETTTYDIRATKGNYEYAIKAFTKDGGESKLSEVVVAEIK